MPVPSQLSTAAHAYRQNAALLNKSFEGLTAEEWLTSPKPTSNPELWFFQAEDGIRYWSVLEFRRVLFRSGFVPGCRISYKIRILPYLLRGTCSKGN